jgi:hypothetical protein
MLDELEVTVRLWLMNLAEPFRTVMPAWKMGNWGQAEQENPMAQTFSLKSDQVREETSGGEVGL